jgi:hypothetical protein
MHDFFSRSFQKVLVIIFGGSKTASGKRWFLSLGLDRDEVGYRWLGRDMGIRRQQVEYSLLERSIRWLKSFALNERLSRRPNFLATTPLSKLDRIHVRCPFFLL